MYTLETLATSISMGPSDRGRYLMDIFTGCQDRLIRTWRLSFKSRSKDIVAIVTMDLSQNMYGINIHYRRHIRVILEGIRFKTLDKTKLEDQEASI